MTAPTIPFEPSNVETFMGGTFDLKLEVNNVGQAKAVFRSILKELEGWGEDSTEVGEFECMRGEIHITLKDGIVQ